MIRVVSVALGLVVLLSCTPRTTTTCLDAGDCAGVAICTTAGTCLEVECTESAQCALGNHCDLGTHTCVTGCGDDDDCLAGESCNGGECEAYGCRDTDLDCHYGETCNQQTGACEKTTEPHCRPANTNAERRDCVTAFGGSVYCWQQDAQGNLSDCYCLLSCQANVEDACPRGMECLVPQVGADPICYGDCPFLIANQ